MNRIILVLLTTLAPFFARATDLQPKYDLKCIANAIGQDMKVTFDAAIPLPKLLLSANVQNGFDETTNTIMIDTNSDDYTGTDHTVDDLIAREMVHFFQIKYGKTNTLPGYGEYEADLLQTWFQQKFVEQGADPCSFTI